MLGSGQHAWEAKETMKFLVQVGPSQTLDAPAPEQLPELLQGSTDVINLQIAQGQLDCAYSTGQNRGFAIANAETVDAVWELVGQNPLSAFWDVEITALGDPIRISEIQLAQVEQALAGVR